MKELTYWVNGEFVPAGQALIPITHRGYRMGDSVFDTERTFNGKIFRLEAHLERLEKSLAFTRIDAGMSMDALARASQETMARNLELLDEYGDFWITQTVSRGMGPVTASGPGFVSIIVEPLPFARVADCYAHGMPLVTPMVRTSAAGGIDPKVKSTSRMHMVLADQEAKSADPKALALLLEETGDLAEVLHGNVFVVKNGRIFTPGSRAILQGVTRATTIELAQQEGLEISETRLQPYDLLTADEAFITTTSYCLLPVASLNGQSIGSVRPGPITRQLLHAWNRLAGLDIAQQARDYAARSQGVTATRRMPR